MDKVSKGICPISAKTDHLFGRTQIDPMKASTINDAPVITSSATGSSVDSTNRRIRVESDVVNADSPARHLNQDVKVRATRDPREDVVGVQASSLGNPEPANTVTREPTVGTPVQRTDHGGKRAPTGRTILRDKRLSTPALAANRNRSAGVPATPNSSEKRKSSTKSKPSSPTKRRSLHYREPSKPSVLSRHTGISIADAVIPGTPALRKATATTSATSTPVKLVSTCRGSRKPDSSATTTPTPRKAAITVLGNVGRGLGQGGNGDAAISDARGRDMNGDSKLSTRIDSNSTPADNVTSQQLGKSAIVDTSDKTVPGNNRNVGVKGDANESEGSADKACAGGVVAGVIPPIEIAPDVNLHKSSAEALDLNSNLAKKVEDCIPQTGQNKCTVLRNETDCVTTCNIQKTESISVKEGAGFVSITSKETPRSPSHNEAGKISITSGETIGSSAQKYSEVERKEDNGSSNSKRNRAGLCKLRSKIDTALNTRLHMISAEQFVTELRTPSNKVNQNNIKS